MNASLQKKDNTYYVVISTVDTSGKHKTKWVTTRCGKKSDASVVMRDILSRMDRGGSMDGTKYGFLEFLSYWLENIIRPQIEQTTYEGYVKNLNDHIKPYFLEMNLKLADVKLAHLQRFINDEHKSGRLDGKGGLSGQSIKKHMANISKALDYAVKTGLILQNPARYVEFPKSKSFVGSFYSIAEIDKLLAACKGTTIEAPIMLATHYGLRRGEIMGLRWCDVDFAEGTLTICNTRVRVKDECEKPPKSESSRRTFPLIPSVKAYLETLKAEQDQNRIDCGKSYNENGFICKWADGRPLELGYINSSLTKILRKNEMRHIRLHDLRHSTASYLNKLGFSPKEIQVWLGHSDIKTTMNIYTHIDIGMKENIAARIDGLFAG